MAYSTHIFQYTLPADPGEPHVEAAVYTYLLVVYTAT